MRLTIILISQSTSSITITDDSGETVSSRPLSSLIPGGSAVIRISLEGTGVTAKIWTIKINGVVSDTVNAATSGFYVSASSWAEIIESAQTSATIKAEPPEDLSTDSSVTLLITDINDKEYTADLGTVKASSSSDETLGSSSSGCNAGFGIFALAMLASSLFFGRKY